jgi:dynein heavy chain
MRKWCKVMDRIQRNLDTYLEDKRYYFARFYFISNDELLQILSTAANLRNIEKHMNKCFGNINKFILADDKG